MRKYICENTECGWEGDAEEVNWVYGHQLMGIEEPQDEHDLELICVCPKCEPLTMAFEVNI